VTNDGTVDAVVRRIGLRLLSGWLGGLLGVAGALAVTQPSVESQEKLRQVESLAFLGQASFGGRSLILDGALLGGLSGLTYDPQSNLFYSISDDRSENAPARFYRLQIEPQITGFGRQNVRFLRSQTLLQPDQTPFTPNSLDPEGIALTPQGKLWISSEGIAPDGVAPFVREFSLGGEHGRSLPLPQHYWPMPDWGVRNNFGFESLTLTPSGNYVMTAVENALVQDGPAASVTQSSPSRLLLFDLAAQQVAGEYLYNTDPVVAAPKPTDAFSAAGLVELLALDDDRYLALERMYAAGSVGMPGNNGMSVRLYEIDRRRATNIQTNNGLAGTGMARVIPVEKQLVLDLTTLGIPLGNLEGMAFGPRLADGRRSLILVSDDNFGAGQFTQILLFAVNE
jgi:hypothetical protein